MISKYIKPREKKRKEKVAGKKDGKRNESIPFDLMPSTDLM